MWHAQAKARLQAEVDVDVQRLLEKADAVVEKEEEVITKELEHLQDKAREEERARLEAETQQLAQKATQYHQELLEQAQAQCKASIEGARREVQERIAAELQRMDAAIQLKLAKARADAWAGIEVSLSLRVASHALRSSAAPPSSPDAGSFSQLRTVVWRLQLHCRVLGRLQAEESRIEAQRVPPAEVPYQAVCMSTDVSRPDVCPVPMCPTHSLPHNNRCVPRIHFHTCNNPRFARAWSRHMAATQCAGSSSRQQRSS